MLYRLDKLIGMSIGATNGDVGKIKDVYFDDQYWAVRYLVVDTGGWLADRKVLISPFTIARIDRDERMVHLRLTKEQIENSPSIDTQMPVSRQHEVDLGEYYGYPEYWSGLMLWGAAPFPMLPVDDVVPEKVAAASAVADGDPHLHSIKEVSGYHLQASDDAIGHLEDFLIEDDSWAVRYLVVDTRDWWPGKHVVIPPQWIKQVSWSEKTVRVDVTRKTVKSAPEYDAEIDFSRTYEESLYQHYERTRYWQ